MMSCLVVKCNEYALFEPYFEPKVLLLDEVTSALDATNTSIVENVVDELYKKGITIISITHNEEQSLRTANRRITIVDGQLAKEEALR